MNWRAPPWRAIDAEFHQNVFYSYGAQIVTLALGFIAVTLITRYAGIRIYGMTAILVAATSLLSGVLTSRNNDAIVKFHTRGRAEDKPNLCKTVLLLGFLLDLGLGLVLLGLLFLFSPLIAEHLLKDPVARQPVVIYALVAFLTFIRGSSYGLLVAKSSFRTVQKMAVIEQLLRTVLLAVTAAMAAGLSLQAIAEITLVTSGVTTAGYLYFLAREISTLHAARIDLGYLREIFRFMAAGFVISTVKAGNLGVDTLVLGVISSPASVGIYSLFKQFLSPVMMLPIPFSTQVGPGFVAANVERRRGEILATITAANRTLMLYFAILTVAIVPAALLYGVWNELHYQTDHYLAFLIMLVGAFVQLLLWWCRPFSVAVSMRLSLAATTIYAASVLLLTYPLTYFLGIVGAATSVTTSFCMVGIYWMWEWRRYRNAA